MEELTIANLFTSAGETMTGFMKLTGDFFTGLWSNPIGKIIVTASIVGGAIALGRSLYLRKKRLA